jgi:hypothetical protein
MRAQRSFPEVSAWSRDKDTSLACSFRAYCLRPGGTPLSAQGDRRLPWTALPPPCVLCSISIVLTAVVWNGRWILMCRCAGVAGCVRSQWKHRSLLACRYAPLKYRYTHKQARPERPVSGATVSNGRRGHHMGLGRESTRMGGFLHRTYMALSTLTLLLSLSLNDALNALNAPHGRLQRAEKGCK